jgi:hypothetical protein
MLMSESSFIGNLLNSNTEQIVEVFHPRFEFLSRPEYVFLGNELSVLPVLVLPSL